MKFNKIMVDTLYEIRKQQPIHIKPQLKLSTLNIGWLLTRIYDTTNNKQVQKLIIVFMREAGDHWLRQLLNCKIRQAANMDIIPDESMKNVIFMESAKHKITYRTPRANLR